MSEKRKEDVRDITTPLPGHFKMRLVRGGPWVGAEIRSTLIGTLVAFCNGESVPVDQVWTAGQAIEEAEFARLDANRPADPRVPTNFRGGAADMVPAGGNAPVLALEQALEPGRLKAWLDHEYASHIARTVELGMAYGRFLLATEAGIADEQGVRRATDFARMHQAEVTALDATRVRIKKPVLHAQRLIDGEASRLGAQLRTQLAEIEQRIAVFLAAKAAAVAAAQDIAAASVPLSEATRTRTDAGALAALREDWTYEVADMRQVPRGYLMLNDSAVKAAIKKGERNIAGLRIYPVQKAYVR